MVSVQRREGHVSVGDCEKKDMDESKKNLAGLVGLQHVGESCQTEKNKKKKKKGERQEGKSSDPTKKNCDKKERRENRGRKKQ